MNVFKRKMAYRKFTKATEPEQATSVLLSAAINVTSINEFMSRLKTGLRLMGKPSMNTIELFRFMMECHMAQTHNDQSSMRLQVEERGYANYKLTIVLNNEPLETHILSMTESDLYKFAMLFHGVVNMGTTLSTKK